MSSDRPLCCAQPHGACPQVSHVELRAGYHWVEGELGVGHQWPDHEVDHDGLDNLGLHGIVIDYDILRPDVEVDHTIEDKNNVDVDTIDYKVDHYVHISCVPSVYDSS